jgi:hypothetical protein
MTLLLIALGAIAALCLAAGAAILLRRRLAERGTHRRADEPSDDGSRINDISRDMVSTLGQNLTGDLTSVRTIGGA